MRATLALALWLSFAGCMGPRGPSGPVRSPTGKVYDPGTPPTRSQYSQTAALLLSQGMLDRALAIAYEGLDADTANPIHYFLAGLAQVRLGLYEDAHAMFGEAEGIYPAYELEVEPERQAAWVALYNRGSEAYNNGEIEQAIDAWERATMIYDIAPETSRNLASVYIQEGRYDEAVRVSEQALAGLAKRPATRVLDSVEVDERAALALATEATLSQLYMFTSRYEEAEPLLRRQLARDTGDVQLQTELASALAGQGRSGEAVEVYEQVLARPDVEGGRLFELGIALFRFREFGLASRAFGRLTELRPSSRDVWFNYANALFGAAEWDSLATVGARLVELDPLGEQSGLIVARALLGAGDSTAALAALDAIDRAPVYVEELQMRPLEAITRVQGVVIGNAAEPGLPVTLRFSFYDEAQPVGRETVTVAAPPPGDSVGFEVQFTGGATAYSYELVSAVISEPASTL